MPKTSGAGRSRPSLLPVLLTTTILSGLPVAAVAQQSGGLEVVTVTAEKREENLQRVPMNVQAITSEKLSDLHLTDFTDFVKYMPSVNYAVSGQGSNGGPGFANITMRGIASDQNGNHSGPLPTVGVYLDEQPITTIGGTLDVPTYDVERVEALSGPQGTLYGASSESGTIRIITNKPDASAFDAAYEAEINSVNHGGVGYKVDGHVNIPLRDNIAVRLVAWDEHDAGWIDNVKGTRTFPGDPTGAASNPPVLVPPVTISNASRAKNNYNTVDKIGARLALGIELDNNWTITPVITAQSEHSDGVFAYAKDGPYGYNRPLKDFQVLHFFPEFVKDKWYQAALTVTGKIANLDVVYSGGYMARTIDSEADYTDYTFWYQNVYPSYDQYFVDNSGTPVDPSQYIVGHDYFTKQSHELRLSTSKDNRLRAVAGVFYEDQTHYILQDYKIAGNIADSGPFNATVTGWPHTWWLTDELREDRDFALFGEASFDITSNLTLTGGIRYFTANNSLKGFFGFHSYESRCFAPTSVDRGPCTDLRARVRESGETHKVNLTWQIDDDRMVYATYSTGFRPGGVNRRTDIPGVGPYTSDTLDNYEVGWKTSWNDNRLRFNGALYWENWNKFQFPFLGPNSVTIIANAGQATVKGMETQITWLPIDSLTLSGSAAYNDANLASDYCGGDCATHSVKAPKGTQLPITPKWKLNATARYEFPVADNIQGHLQGSVQHQSETWADLRKAERALLGPSRASTTFDFIAGIDRDNWQIDLSVLNVFDTKAQRGRYAECTPGTCGPQTYILTAQPRTIGLSFSQKF
ncbi:MAG: TonB-dependent receptor [Proteobacteria bacterium]|nr:TonB-dependent receptor [Pseudomonadota bacterium]